MVTAEAIDGANILDIRQHSEFASGHLPGASHLELGELAHGLPELPPGPTVVMCGHGDRAMSAASLLQRAGPRDVAVLDGGPDSWAEASGRSLQVSR